MFNTKYYYYDGYICQVVKSLSTRGFNLVLGIEILTIDHFQYFLGFFETPGCIVNCISSCFHEGIHYHKYKMLFIFHEWCKHNEVVSIEFYRYGCIKLPS